MHLVPRHDNRTLIRDFDRDVYGIFGKKYLTWSSKVNELKPPNLNTVVDNSHSSIISEVLGDYL